VGRNIKFLYHETKIKWLLIAVRRMPVLPCLEARKIGTLIDRETSGAVNGEMLIYNLIIPKGQEASELLGLVLFHHEL
jgi:hypothetical protein